MEYKANSGLNPSAFSEHFDKIIYPPGKEFFPLGLRYDKSLQLVFRCPLFFGHAFLRHLVPCHALFSYAMKATMAWLDDYHEPIIDEDTPWPEKANYRQLMTNTARQYGVRESDMVKHWDVVDFQFIALGRRRLPDEERFRFNRPGEIRCL